MLEQKPQPANQPDLIDATQRYVGEVLHVPVSLRPWPKARELPTYLRTAYTFAEGSAGDTAALWLMREEPIAPKALAKHVDAVAARWPATIVAVFRQLPSYTRQRLVARGLAFVVPGTQLYLPQLGVEFKNRATITPVERPTLRPSAQALLLHLLHHGESRTFTPGSLAEKLGYTPMTMSRAVTELEVADLIVADRAARTRTFRLKASPSETWAVAQQRLVSPVTRTLLVMRGALAGMPHAVAGLSALAEYSDLAAPSAAALAVAPNTARSLVAAAPAPAAGWTPDALEEDEQLVEVWSYDPRALSDGHDVDRLSLFLSLRDNPDERVQGALDQMMGGLGW